MIFSFNHEVHCSLEYHSVCPLVLIGNPPSSARECVPPGTKGGTHSPAGEGFDVAPIRTTGEKVWRDLSQETTKNRNKKENLFAVLYIFVIESCDTKPKT